MINFQVYYATEDTNILTYWALKYNPNKVLIISGKVAVRKLLHNSFVERKGP